MSNPLKGTPPPPIQWTKKEDGKLYPPTLEQIQAYQEWYEAQEFPKPDVQAMSLREKIADICGTIEYSELPDKGAEKILTLFREAMTSELVVSDAATAAEVVHHDGGQDFLQTATHTITAALDAAMKEN